MIDNQKISQAAGTPLRKRLVIGATCVLATGALLGVGATGAFASTVQPTPAATHASSSAHSGDRSISIIEQLRADLFQGQISGSKAQALATHIIGANTIFSALPAAAQSDLRTLKSAPAAGATAQAQKIKSTALAGGYGQQVKELATALQASAKYPISKTLVREIRRDLTSGGTIGATGASIAKTLSEHPQLLAKLPANLQSDVTALKNAPVSDETSGVLGIESGAVAGKYGPQIQTLAQQLVSTAVGSK